MTSINLTADEPEAAVTDERLAAIVAQIDQWGETKQSQTSDILRALQQLQALRAALSKPAEVSDAVVGEYGELDAGINYTIERLCEILGVDPKSISWDAATETMDGDVVSVICNVLIAAYGEEWSSKPESTAAIRAALSAASLVPTDGWPVGTPVTKPKGYAFPGEIRAAFHTKAGELRYVVEATGGLTPEELRAMADLAEAEPASPGREILRRVVGRQGYAGMLHIFSPAQLPAAPTPPKGK